MAGLMNLRKTALFTVIWEMRERERAGRGGRDRGGREKWRERGWERERDRGGRKGGSEGEMEGGRERGGERERDKGGREKGRERGDKVQCTVGHKYK